MDEFPWDNKVFVPEALGVTGEGYESVDQQAAIASWQDKVQNEMRAMVRPPPPVTGTRRDTHVPEGEDPNQALLVAGAVVFLLVAYLSWTSTN